MAHLNGEGKENINRNQTVKRVEKVPSLPQPRTDFGGPRKRESTPLIQRKRPQMGGHQKRDLIGSYCCKRLQPNRSVT